MLSEIPNLAEIAQAHHPSDVLTVRHTARFVKLSVKELVVVAQVLLSGVVHSGPPTMRWNVWVPGPPIHGTVSNPCSKEPPTPGSSSSRADPPQPSRRPFEGEKRKAVGVCSYSGTDGTLLVASSEAEAAEMISVQNSRKSSKASRFLPQCLQS